MLELERIGFDALINGINSKKYFYHGLMVRANEEDDNLAAARAKFSLAFVKLYVYIHHVLFGLKQDRGMLPGYDLLDIKRNLSEVLNKIVPNTEGMWEDQINAYLESPGRDGEVVNLINSTRGVLGICAYCLFNEKNKEEEIDVAINLLTKVEVLSVSPLYCGYAGCVEINQGLRRVLDCGNVLNKPAIHSSFDSIMAGKGRLIAAIRQCPPLRKNEFLFLVNKRKEEIECNDVIGSILLLLAFCYSFFFHGPLMHASVFIWLLLKIESVFERYALSPVLGVFVKEYNKNKAYIFLVQACSALKKTGFESVIRKLNLSKKTAPVLKLLLKSFLLMASLFFIHGLGWEALVSKVLFFGLTSLLFNRLYHAQVVMQLFSRHGLMPLSVLKDQIKYYFPRWVRYWFGIRELVYRLETVTCDQELGDILVGSMAGSPMHFVLGDPVAAVPAASESSAQHSNTRAVVLISARSFPTALCQVNTFSCALERELSGGRFHSVWVPASLPEGFRALGSISYVGPERLNRPILNSNSSDPDLPSELKSRFKRVIGLHKDLLIDVKPDLANEIALGSGQSVQFMQTQYSRGSGEYQTGSGSFFLKDPSNPDRAGVRLRSNKGFDDETYIIRRVNLPGFFVSLCLGLIASVLGSPFGSKASSAFFLAVFTLSQIVLFHAGNSAARLSGLFARGVFHQIQQRLGFNHPPAGLSC